MLSRKDNWVGPAGVPLPSPSPAIADRRALLSRLVQLQKIEFFAVARRNLALCCRFDVGDARESGGGVLPSFWVRKARGGGSTRPRLRVAGCGAVSGFLLSIYLCASYASPYFLPESERRILPVFWHPTKVRTSYSARILTSDENPNAVFCPYFDIRRESERRILPVF